MAKRKELPKFRIHYCINGKEVTKDEALQHVKDRRNKNKQSKQPA